MYTFFNSLNSSWMSGVLTNILQNTGIWENKANKAHLLKGHL